MESLNENKKYLAIFELFFSLISATILFPVGLFFSIIIQPFLFRIKGFKLLKYLINFIKQIFNVFMYLFHFIAFSIDLLGNVIVGDLLELIITKERDTWFGSSKHSISQSVGYLEFNKKLNKRGQKFSNLLSRVFGKNHCINAYQNYADGSRRNK